MSRSKARSPVHGWIVIDKPCGLSSAAVVARVRRVLDIRKAGHAGTLDPLASGILPIAVGEATKTVRWMMERQKTYRFTVRFGEARDTDDAAGQVVGTSSLRPQTDAVTAALPMFTGSIIQTPPRYSAVKIDGKRAYARARAGEVVKPQPRRVTVSRFALIDRPDADHARFEVVCGKGTYIRSLARDLAHTLGSCGHVHALRRTAVGSFSEDGAISLDKLQPLVHIAPSQNYLLPVTAALDDIPALTVTETQAEHLRRGAAVRVASQAVRPDNMSNTALLRESVVLCALSRTMPVALARLIGDELRPIRVFNL